MNPFINPNWSPKYYESRYLGGIDSDHGVVDWIANVDEVVGAVGGGRRWRSCLLLNNWGIAEEEAVPGRCG